MANQDQTYIDQTHIQTPDPIRYPTPTSPVRLPVLTQQITAEFQLSQEAWNKLRRQMTEMAETSTILKRAVKNIYKKVNSIPNLPPKKPPTPHKLQES